MKTVSRLGSLDLRSPTYAGGRTLGVPYILVGGHWESHICWWEDPGGLIYTESLLIRWEDLGVPYVLSKSLHYRAMKDLPNPLHAEKIMWLDYMDFIVRKI